MPTQAIRIHTRTWTPASATTDETVAFFSIAKGQRVLWASATPLVMASVGQVGTITLGDVTDPDGFIVAFTPTAALMTLGTPLGGGGAYLANSGGKLYTAATTIDVVWDYTSGGVIFPVVRFRIATVKGE
jgi:hypothetical protein